MGMRKVWKDGTPLFDIIEGGLARDFEIEQIIEEAQAMGHAIDARLVEAVKRDFELRMQQCLT
jgi:hypothetical protein